MGLNFEIGKPVVCIKNHSQGFVKEGEIFKLLDIQQGICDCESLLLYVGHTRTRATAFCRKCGKVAIPPDHRLFLGSFIFAPLDDIHEAECVFAELMEEVEVCEPVLV